MKNLPPKAFPSIRELQDHADFWMSDHARFWYYKEENELMTFPSILLTDTGRTFSVIWVKKNQLQYSKSVSYQLLKVRLKVNINLFMSSCTLFWDIILGQKFVMISQC